MLKTLLYLIVTLSLNIFAQQQYAHMSTALTEITGQKYLVVQIKHEKDWHTYWKNPGDAGLAIKFEHFVDGNKLELEELEWPTPKKYIEQGDMLAYGYSDTVYFFFKLNKFSYEKVLEKNLTTKAKWLVCKDICIPGTGENSLLINKKLPIQSPGFKSTTTALESKLSMIPQRVNIPKQLDLQLVKADGKNQLALQWTYNVKSKNRFNPKRDLLTPFLTNPLDYKRETISYNDELKSFVGRSIIAWDGEYEEPPVSLPKDGILQTPLKLRFLFQDLAIGKTSVIEKEFSRFNLSGFSSFDKLLSTKSKVKTADKVEKSIFYYLLFAFIGGLILNLMPCVLPVISLKLFGLISHQNESKRSILKHNLFYTLGVIFSFFTLAIVVIMIKETGKQIGWGFQLQSPLFVFLMITILFIMSLNLFGLFEFRTPFGQKLGNTNIKNNYSGDFFNGIIATILSTPCSAPFLGAALGFAFTSSSFNILLIFFMIAIGLSFPFILTGFFPSLVSFLPKPGNWMNKLKYFLGLSLLLTIAWLFDVFSALIEINAHAFMFICFFAFIYFFVLSYQKISKIIALIFLVLASWSFYSLYQNNFFQVRSEQVVVNEENWQSWSINKMSELKKQNKIIFIDFTAKWCLTCKVNKKLVLDTDAFNKFAKNKEMTLLRGDWTKYDPEITNYLQSFSIAGVPAYFIIKSDGETISLGETISISKIKKALDESTQ